MRFAFQIPLLSFVVLSTACHLVEKEPVIIEPRIVPRHDAQAFFETVSFRGLSFSSDGTRLLVTTDETGVYNAYSIPAIGGDMTQLTYSTTDATYGVSWFPEDDRFVVTADRGGNELNHVYVRQLDGSLVDVTPGDELKARFRGWAGDDSSFFVLSNEREATSFDLYRYYVSGRSPVEASALEEMPGGYLRRVMLRNPGGYDISGVSQDGSWIALTKVRNNADSDVYIRRTDAPDAEPIHVTPHEGDISHSFASFSHDGSTLYYFSNEEHEFDRVWSYDIESGEHAVVFEDVWDVTSYRFSRDGRFLTTSVNADARTVVRAFDAKTMAEIELPEVPAGDVREVTFGPHGDRIAFYVNGDTQPSNLYVYDRRDSSLECLTAALNPEIDADDLVQAQNVRYPSFDDVQIPALLYRPHSATAENPAPALVWVHGGPGGQSRRGYNPMLQHLVNHGYAILAVNNRGSSGYGKTFHHMDDQKPRRRRPEGLCLRPHVPRGARLGRRREASGSSAAATAATWCCAALAFEPEAFDGRHRHLRCDELGSHAREHPARGGRTSARGAVRRDGQPGGGCERLHADLPALPRQATSSSRCSSLQGANDPRVLQAESDDMVAAVRNNGVPVQYVLFPDEGHGFRSRANRIRASQAYLEFLVQYL